MKLKNGEYKFISHQERYDFEQDFPFMTNCEMSKKYNCNWRTIVRKARELNLQKDELFRVQFDFRLFGAKGAEHPDSITTRFKEGMHVSPATEFKTGNIPWIKGKSFSEIYMNRYLKTIPVH